MAVETLLNVRRFVCSREVCARGGVSFVLRNLKQVRELAKKGFFLHKNFSGGFLECCRLQNGRAHVPRIHGFPFRAEKAWLRRFLLPQKEFR